METFEIEFGGEIYEIEAPDEQSAMNALAEELGEQSAAAMVPSPADFGQAPVPRENVFGDVTAEAMEQPLEALQFYRQRAADPERSILQRAGDVGMTGLSALGAGMAGASGVAAETVAPVGNVFRRALDMPTLDPKTAERRLAADLMMGLEVAVPELTGVTSGATRLGRQVTAGKAIPGAREIGEMTPRMEGARAAEQIGVLPSAGMQGRGTAMVESGFEASPFSTGQIQAGRERVVSEMQDVATGAAERAGVATTKEAAGEAAQAGVKKFVSDFTKKSEVLYNQVDRFIKPNDLIVAPNTTQALREIVQFASDNPEIARQLGLSKYQDLLRALGEGGIDTAVPYQLVKDLRSTFGEAIGNMTGPLADMSQAKIKRLYGTLSQDMEQAAMASGPDAYKAWKRANDYYNAGMTRIDDTLSKITDAEGGTAAYRRLENMLLEGNVKQSTKQIMQIKKSLSADDFNTFRATLINNLGRAKAGAQGAEGDLFSPATFLTNYNKLDPTSRKIVLGELEPELKQLASVVEMSKDAAAQLNASRTAPALTTQAFYAGVGALALSPAQMIGIYAANKAGAGVMTNKAFLRALNAAAKKDMGPLQRLAGGDGYLAAEAATLLRTLSAQQANVAE